MTFASKKLAGVSLLELIIVLAIIGTLVCIGAPALMRAHENSKAKVCQTNLHQMSVALSNLCQIQKKLPLPPAAGKVGGWSYEILPFVEEQNLFKLIARGSSLSSVAKSGLNRPRVMNCPLSPIDLSDDAPMQASHYAIIYIYKDIFHLSEVPITNRRAWLNGQEIKESEFATADGPHDRGYHTITNQGAVDFHSKD